MYKDLVKENMLKHFKKQLEGRKPITKELLSQLKGKSLYSNYQIGDIVLAFLYTETKKDENIEQTELFQTFEGCNGKNFTMYPPAKKITISLCNIVKREINKLSKDFVFVEMKESIPVFIKI